MTLWQLIFANLRYHRRTGPAVATGVAVATAVLTGALLVGDSVRGSLEDLVTDRLGHIDHVLLTERFFRRELAAELAASPQFDEDFDGVTAAVLSLGTVEKRYRRPTGGVDRDATAGLAGSVTIIGSDESFLALGEGGPSRPPAKDEVVLNRQLADEIGAVVGDEVLLRVGRSSEIPADSPLGRKTETTRSRRLKVSEIVPTEGLGRFGLSPTQQLPQVAFASLATLQEMLDQPGRVNALLVAGKSKSEASSAEASERLVASLRPRLTDYGVKIEHVLRNIEIDDDDPVATIDYYNLTCDRMLLPEALQQAAARAWSNEIVQPALTYLANEIRKPGDEGKSIPYSIVTAIDSRDDVGPLFDEAGQPITQLADDEIVLNSWAADDLAAQVGDEIALTYFRPDTTHGEVEEATATFRLAAIVPLAEADQPPLPANDPDLTPELPGVTDQASIDDWNPPFPFESERIRQKDEDYWDDHRTTPKAFISLAAGRRLWSSRFGDTTSLRVAPAPGSDVQQLAAALQNALAPAGLGFELRPVKRFGLEAARGTTPFDLLFLGFSMFLIAAALMLVALLYRLGVEQRATEVGLLQGVGFARRRTARLLAAEGLMLAAVGSAIGVLIGVLYASVMLYGLRTWWVDAVSTPFLVLHVTVKSLGIGFLAGLVTSALTIYLTLRRLGKISVRELLAGRMMLADDASTSGGGFAPWIMAGTLMTAVVLLASAGGLSGEAQAGAFFGAGALVLVAALVAVRSLLSDTRAWHGLAGGAAAVKLAARAAARNPLRSTLTIGLVAAASFLIVAISAFQLDVSTSGSGGYDILATSSAPIYHDLGTEDGRFEIGIGTRADRLLAEAEVVALRVESGDDASCLNLFQARRPQVLGIPPALAANDRFQWAAALEDATEREDDGESPWSLLEAPLRDDEQGRTVVPVIVDQNTATYSLHLAGLGAQWSGEDEQRRPVMFEVVGLLKNSIFQGSLLVSEDHFETLFPSTSGYRQFLVRAPDGQALAIRGTLETELRDFGFDAVLAVDRLRELMAVQNTYLSTFQSLGGLGLLLGTVGLAVVQLRSVLERRGELALMRAVGFRSWRLATIVFFETAWLLAAGLGVGIVAAIVVVLPHWLAGGAAIPWVQLLITLSFVVVTGLAAAMVSVRATLRAPLLAALRGS